MISKINEIVREELQKLLDSSTSFVDILQKIGMSSHTGNRKTLKSRIEKEKLDLSKLNKNRNEWRKKFAAISTNKNARTLSDILKVGIKYNSPDLKRRLIKENLLENKCALCGQLPEWNGKPLTLQLDHINGVHNDNRLENLRILCPNCHTQTETWGGKKEKNHSVCLDCGDLKKWNKGIRCNDCSKKQVGINQRKFEVTKEELEKLIAEKPMTQIGKMFGVSDNAIRKRLKRFVR